MTGIHGTAPSGAALKPTGRESVKRERGIHMNAYTSRILEGLKQRNANESEFLQAATEILESISPVFDKHPEYEKAGLLERFVEPERVILFRIP